MARFRQALPGKRRYAWARPERLASIVVAAGLVLRLIYALSLPNDFPRWRDSQHYIAITRNLIDGHGYADSVGIWSDEPIYSDVGPTSFWLPVYPFFLAGVFSLVGESARAVFVTQALIGGLTLLLTWSCARLLLGNRIALLALLLLSLNPYHIYETGKMGTELLGTLILVGTLLLSIHCAKSIHRRGKLPKRLWIALWVVLAVGMLEKTAFVTVGAVIGAYLVVMHARQNGRLAAVVTPVLLAAVTTLIVLSPWFIRNYMLWNRVVYDTNTGLNLWIGNNDHASGGFDLAHVPRLDAREFDEIERDDLLREQAVRWAAAHPLHAAYLFAKKEIMIWNPVPARQRGLWLLVGTAWGCIFLGLCAVGLLRLAVRPAQLALPLLITGGYLVTIGFAFAITRFRIPIEAPLALFGAYGLDGAIDRLNLKRSRSRRVAYEVLSENPGHPE